MAHHNYIPEFDEHAGRNGASKKLNYASETSSLCLAHAISKGLI